MDKSRQEERSDAAVGYKHWELLDMFVLVPWFGSGGHS